MNEAESAGWVDWACLVVALVRRATLPGSAWEPLWGKAQPHKGVGLVALGASCLPQASIFPRAYFCPWPGLVVPSPVPWLMAFLPWLIKN